MQSLHAPQHIAQWLRARVRGRLLTDSRQIRPGDGFVAWPGAATDGRRFVAQALDQGAAACLVEQDGVDVFMQDPVWRAAIAGRGRSDRIACSSRLKANTGPIASAYFAEPSRAIDVLAITGTNGKTSTAWWLALALEAGRADGAPPACAVIGTLGVGLPPALEPTGLTTPDPVLLHGCLREWVDRGVPACAIEASSIGLAEHRLDGLHIHTAVYTNFTQDHLDYHGDMASYWKAKRVLFDWPGLKVAVLNVDDPQGAALAAELGVRPELDLWTVSCQPQGARLWIEALGHPAQGLQGLQGVLCEGRQRVPLHTRVIGRYNMNNLLGVLAVLRARGVPLEAAAAQCRDLLPVPGRMTPVGGANEPLVVIDYAHTPDALEQALLALRPLAQARQGRLWCVFGCGGGRDSSKRPLMAAVAERSADTVVLTSDNPRHEEPQAILSQMLLGLTQPRAAQVQVDRALAIRETVAQADAADVILLAGKGHETSQDIQGQRLPFSDQAQAEQALQARRAHGAPPEARP